MDPATASQAGLALTNIAVNKQATMMAYNDVSWFFGLLFLCTIPLAFFIPKRSVLMAHAKRQHQH
jgi:DHA2 family multidrug resistance protein